MKKLLVSLLTAVSLGGITASAQTISNSEDGKYSIKLGDVSMTIDAAKGGKIVSYKYNDSEVLSQTRMANSFGSTFWTSPQSEWNWPPVPEYDTRAFNAEVKGNTLVLTGDKSARFGYRIRKEITTDAKDNAFVITYTIINESGEERKVAPWEFQTLLSLGTPRLPINLPRK